MDAVDRPATLAAGVTHGAVDLSDCELHEGLVEDVRAAFAQPLDEESQLTLTLDRTHAPGDVAFDFIQAYGLFATDATFAGAFSLDGARITVADFTRATFGSSLTARGASATLVNFTDCTLGRRTELGITADSSTAEPTRLTNIRWSEPAAVAIPTGRVRFQRCVITHPLTIGTQIESPADRSLGEQHMDSMFAAREHRPAPAHVEAFVRCTVMAPVTFTGVPLSDTLFEESTGLDQLRFATNPRWRRKRRGLRRIVADERRRPAGRRLSRARRTTRRQLAQQAEPIYRQLRVGLEASKAAPDAADFYVGELEARRRTGRSWWDSWMLLPLYRWVGGYGVRAVPPLLWLLLVVLGTAGLFRKYPDHLVRPTDPTPAVTQVANPAAPAGSTTIVVTPQTNPPSAPTPPTYVVDGYNVNHYPDALAFVLRSSVSLFAAPTAGLKALGTYLLILERFAAVSLLALVLLALRSRVAR